MFSGIRSLLFGYTDNDTSDASGDNNDSKLNNPNEEFVKKSSLGNDTSALLEQTLNAATTKLTEQLLPQSQSIEQLQSSSHQLLPTLIEQHEEDESRERKQIENISSKDGSGDGEKNVDESDDECFNADSWEMLDLNDKPVKTASLNSTVQDDSTSSIGSKQTSGILKPSGNKPVTSSNQNDHAKQALRQKPKVSFETPDLVIEKQEKIEQANQLQPEQPQQPPQEFPGIQKSSSPSNKNSDGGANETTDKVKSKNGKNNNRKKNKKARAVVADEESSKANSSSCSKDHVESGKQNQLCQTLEEAPIIVKQLEQSGSDHRSGIGDKKVPVLNYAAALATKLEDFQSKDSKKSPDEKVCKDETIESKIMKPVSSGSVKRNRPVSSSSWSSSDEVGAVESFWDDVPSQPKLKESSEKPSRDDTVFDMDDNESMMSSGFSDCDYGYNMNDYVMRPKKSQNKRRNGSSNSSSLLSSMSKRGTDRATGQEQQQQASKLSNADTSCRLVPIQKAPSSKNMKPRKKKMVMSPTTCSSEFLKKSLIEVQVSHDLTVSQTDEELPTAVQNPVMQSNQLMLLQSGAANNASSSNSGNDSSDIADMDESWFVTPPPCFTGSNKLNKTKAKEAARENALIEHPSIYIASTSKQMLEKPTVAATAIVNKSSMVVDSLNKQKSIVLKKVQKQNNAPQPVVETESKLKKSALPQLTQAATKKSSRAWGNKFFVSSWEYDEQEDVDDFDSLFESENSLPRPTKKSKAKRKQQHQQRQSTQFKSKGVESSGAINDDYASPASVYESDFPVSSPALVGVTDNLSCSSLDMVVSDNNNQLVEPAQNENMSPCSDLDEVEVQEKVVRERKPPVQVRPIEPEKQPGWQLRRKRRKRRPLTASVANTCGSLTGQSKKVGKQAMLDEDEFQPSDRSAATSGQSSARSTPTLIDRIGSSIVANLTNLTSGFPPSGAVPIQGRASIEGPASQSAVRKSNSEYNLVARRSMSKGYMSRQNDCAKLGNSLRRADRRLKMHTTPNGCSVNRKVQTSFH